MKQIVLKPTRIFSGQKYAFDKAYPLKTKAKKRAESLRKKGFRVRIVPDSGLNGHWCTYTRKFSKRMCREFNRV